MKGWFRTLTEGRIKWILLIQMLWLGIVVALAGWWAHLLLAKNATIYEMEIQAGVSPETALEHWSRFQRMVMFESTAFLTILLMTSALLFFIYWSEILRSRSVQTFFASITHELRTPLTSIRLQAEAIQDQVRTDSSSYQLGRRLLEDTARLESQVERTLELARLEGGGRIFPEPLNLKGFLDRSIRLFSETYGDRVRFSTDVAAIEIFADSTALQIIFKNAFENAIRHSGQDVVTISISASNQSTSGGKWIELKISNICPAFKGNPTALGKLFYKGSASTGTGVGLYLIRTLMRQMGALAKFNFESDRFILRLLFKEVVEK